MATQLHLIHRHTSGVTAPTSSTAKLELGEIAVQHNATDPALWIKLSGSGDNYAKFIPASNINITGETNNPVVVSGAVSGTGITVAHDSISFAATANTNTNVSFGGKITAYTGADTDGYGHVTSISSTTYTLPSETTLSTATTGTGNAVTDIQVSGHQITTVKNKTFLEAADLANYLTGVTVAGDTYISGTVANDSAITLSSDVLTSLTTSSTSGSLVDSKAIVNFVTGQTDSALTAITHGTDGTYVTTTVGNKSSKTQSVGVAVTTGAVTSTTAGLAVNTDVKDYVDGKVKTDVPANALFTDSHVSGSSYHYTATTATHTGGTTTSTAASAIKGITYDDAGHIVGITSGSVLTSHATHAINVTNGTASAATTALTFVESVASAGTATSGNPQITTTRKSINILTAINDNTTSGSLVDSKAVVDYVKAQVTSSVNYKGSTTTLPSSAEVGDLYIASGPIEIASGRAGDGVAVTAETGDYIICRTSGTTTSKWDVIEKNLTGAVTTTAATLTSGSVIVGDGDQKVKASSYTIATSVPANAVFTDTKVTAVSNHYTPTSSATKSATTNYAIAGLKVDAAGHVVDVVDSAHKVEKDVPSNAVFTDTATTESGHYAPTGTTTTIGGSGKYIQSIGLDTKKHVYTAATANTADIVVNSAKTATTISGTITASKVSDFNSAVASAETKITTGSSGTGAFVTAITTDGNHQVIANLGTPASIHDTATTETGHYTPSATSSTVGSADGFIKQIKIDSKKHVIEVTTGTPAAVSVVNSAPSLPVNGGSKVQIGTVAGTALTADVTMQSLTIAGAKNASGTSIEEFNGTAANTIAILDCGSY